MTIEELYNKNPDEFYSILGQYDRDMLIRLAGFLVLDDKKQSRDTVSDSNAGNDQNIRSFADLMREMQRKYDFLELQKFDIEGGKVFINVDGKKIKIDSVSASKSSLQNIQSPSITQNEIKQSDQLKDDSRFRRLEFD